MSNIVPFGIKVRGSEITSLELEKGPSDMLFSLLHIKDLSREVH